MSVAVQYDSRRKDVRPLDPNFTMLPGAFYIDAQRAENHAREYMEKVREMRPQ